MKIDIKATNLDLTPAINQYIEDKVGSLDKFLKRFELENEIRVFVEISRTTRHHKSGDVFRAEASLPLGKKLLRVEHTDFDARVAIDKARNKLGAEIKKYKEIKTDKR